MAAQGIISPASAYATEPLDSCATRRVRVVKHDPRHLDARWGDGAAGKIVIVICSVSAAAEAASRAEPDATAPLRPVVPPRVEQNDRVTGQASESRRPMPCRVGPTRHDPVSSTGEAPASHEDRHVT
jgi:hypothetical protein